MAAFTAQVTITSGQKLAFIESSAYPVGINKGDFLFVASAGSIPVEINKVIGNSAGSYIIELLESWPYESVNSLSSIVIPTTLKFQSIMKLLQDANLIFNENTQALHDWQTKLGQVNFNNLDGTQTTTKTLKQIEIDLEHLAENINDYWSIKVMLIANGFNGNVGFFEQGFTYENIGDVGIDTNKKIYKYIGEGAPVKTVEQGTDPENNENYEQVLFNGNTNVSTPIKLNKFLTKLEMQAAQGVEISEGDICFLTSQNGGFFVAKNKADNEYAIGVDTKQGVYVPMSNSSLVWVRQYSGGLYLDWFSPHEDGVTDDRPVIECIKELCKIRPIGKITAGREKKYFISEPISFHNNIEFDLNQSTFIAPLGFIVARKTIESYTAGNYFTANEGEGSFTIPSGLEFEKGEVLLLESNDTRQAKGNYKHGQFTYIERIEGDKVILSHGFYENYTVDRIFRRKPLVFHVFNGTVDISGAPFVSSGLPTTAIYMSGWKCKDTNVNIIGGDDAGIGISSEGVIIRSYDFTASNILNRSGFNTGSRFGYGHLAAGCNVVINSPSVSGCKHNILTSNRTFVTLSYTVNDPDMMTPSGHQNDMTDNDINPTFTPQALYQSMIDAHSNCINFVINNPVFKGVNTAIAVRNGYAVINNPIFECYGCTNNFRMDMLINIYEGVTRYVEVNNPVMRFKPNGGSFLPRLVGIQAYEANNHGKVHIYNPDIDHGSYFWFAASSTASISENTHLDELVIKGAKGRTVEGVQITGKNSNSNIGKIGTVVFDAENVKVFGGYGYFGAAVDLRYFSSIDYLRVKGEINPLENVEEISGGQIPTALSTIQIGETDSVSSLGRINLDNLEVNSYFISVRIATSSENVPGFISARGSSFKSALGGEIVEFAPALYTSLPVLPVEYIDLNNSKFWVSKAGLSNSEAVRHVFTTKYTLDNCIINTELAQSTSFNEKDAPIGLRRFDTATNQEQADTLINNAHSLYVKPNGQLTCSGAPSLPANDGTYIYARAPSVGNPFVYVMANNAWVAGPAL